MSQAYFFYQTLYYPLPIQYETAKLPKNGKIVKKIPNPRFGLNPRAMAFLSMISMSSTFQPPFLFSQVQSPHATPKCFDGNFLCKHKQIVNHLQGISPLLSRIPIIPNIIKKGQVNFMFVLINFFPVNS